MESDYIIEDTDIRRLIVKAVEARDMAYARYSQFKVGAALLAGRENSSDAAEVTIEIQMNTECSRAVI